ncbi:MAG: hypothetical protein J6S69_05015 [Proteobacteria bacterium]|nr:hypothetical protein [Pseudomonadota bacterium]
MAFKTAEKAEKTTTKSSQKQPETTNAAMAQQKSSDEKGVQGQQKVQLGSIQNQVEALMNVYSGKASEEDKDIVSAILGFLNRLWSAITSVFKKEPEPQIDKAQVLEKLVEIFGCEADRTKIAENGDLMRRIMTELIPADRNTALDYLYRAVEDPDLLMEIIDVRFGVPVISGDVKTWEKLDEETKAFVTRLKAERDADPDKKKGAEPIAWSAAGLHQVYDVYLLLPQGDLDMIRCLMHCNDKQTGGAAWGYTNRSTGVYYVNYVVGSEHRKQEFNKRDDGKGKVNGHIDHSKDTRNGMIMMNMTTAHELGHVVDGNSGWKLSGPGSSMRQVSKWEETPDVPATVVSEMEKSIAGGAYGGKLNAEELEIARKAAVRYLGRDQSNYTKWNTAEVAMIVDIKDVVKETGSKVDVEDLADTLTDSKDNSNLLYHLWRGQAVNMSCYNHNDAMRGMKRPFHQGYSGQPWFTFDNNAWNDKISCYQFRCPKEEFAETYASYHAAPTIGKQKGENTPAGLLAWFVKEGLGEAIPESAGQKEEESAGSAE